MPASKTQYQSILFQGLINSIRREGGRGAFQNKCHDRGMGGFLGEGRGATERGEVRIHSGV